MLVGKGGWIMGLRDKIVMLISEYWDFIGNVSFCQRLKPSLLSSTLYTSSYTDYNVVLRFWNFKEKNLLVAQLPSES